jgi:hypothetical protein
MLRTQYIQGQKGWKKSQPHRIRVTGDTSTYLYRTYMNPCIDDKKKRLQCIYEATYLPAASLRTVGTSVHAIVGCEVRGVADVSPSAKGSAAELLLAAVEAMLMPSLADVSKVWYSNLASTLPFRGQLAVVVNRARSLESLSPLRTSSSGSFQSTADCFRRNEAPVLGCIMAPVARAASFGCFVTSSSSGVKSRPTVMTTFFKVIDCNFVLVTSAGLSEKGMITLAWNSWMFQAGEKIMGQ